MVLNQNVKQMYKPFTKESANALAYKLQECVGMHYIERDLKPVVQVVSIIPAGHDALMRISEMYFRASNRAIKHQKITDYVRAYSGLEYDVAAFAKAPSATLGFSTTVIPVSTIAVTEDGFDYGFSFLVP